MEDHIVELFNPKDHPYGRLSNHSRHQMTIDGERYDTVTNYILSHMLTSPYGRRLVKDTAVKPIKRKNTELIAAIDHMISLSEPVKKDDSESADSNSFQPRIRLARILDKKSSKFEEWPDSRVLSAYRALMSIRRKSTTKETKRAARNAWKVFRKSGKSYDFVSHLSKHLLSLPSKPETDSVSIDESWHAYAETGALKTVEDKAKAKSDNERVISSYTNKAYDDVDLRQLRDRIIEESNINQMGIYKVYRDSAYKELHHTLLDALTLGYESRFATYPAIAQTLIESGSIRIEYVSPDSMMGMGSDGTGMNIVGQALMQIRNNLQNQAARNSELATHKAHYDRLYQIYVAYTYLSSVMDADRNDISQYLGVPVDQIAQTAQVNTTSKFMDYDSVVSMYQTNRLPRPVITELFNPGTLVILLRQNGLRAMQSALRADIDEIVLEMYMEYTVRSNYMDAVNEKADQILGNWTSYIDLSKNVNADTGGLKMKFRDESPAPNRNDLIDRLVREVALSHKNTMEPPELDDIKNRINDLYKLGMLPSDLSEHIKNAIIEMNVPTDNDVTRAEDAVLPTPPQVDQLPWAPRPNHNVDDQAHSDSESDGERGSLSDSDSDSGVVSSPMGRMISGMLKEGTSRRDLRKALTTLTGRPKSDFKGLSAENMQQRIAKIKIKREKLTSDASPATRTHSLLGVDDHGIGPVTVMHIHAELDNNHTALRPLAPGEYTGMSTIGTFKYPTIQHYVLCRLIASTGKKISVDASGAMSFVKGMGVTDAYEKLLVNPQASGEKTKSANSPGEFLTIALAGEEYDRIDDHTNRFLLKTYATVALLKKFSDQSLQDLLLLTGDRTIIWTSTQDPYLGIGSTNEGGNEVGKIMMSMRDTIREDRGVMENIQIETDYIMHFMQNNKYVMKWVEDRLQEMCGLVLNFQQYLKVNSSFTINLDKLERLIQMINFTLDTVYRPNMYTVTLSEDSQTDVPQFFVSMVWACKGVNAGIKAGTVTDAMGVSSPSTEVKEHLREIDQEISQLNTQFNGVSNRITHTPSEVKAFKNSQREKWVKYVDVVANSGRSRKKRNEDLEEYKREEKMEEAKFFGNVTVVHSPHEIARHNHAISMLQKEKATYKTKVEEADEHYGRYVKKIALIYWTRITGMLSTIITQAASPDGKSASVESIGQSMIEIELRNRNTATNCVPIISDPEENCIMSALLNLTDGIIRFKKQFATNVYLESVDVDLAKSILMGRSYADVSLATPVDTNDEDEGDEGDADDRMDLFLEGDDGLILDESNMQYDDKGEGVGYEDSPYFAFSKSDWGRVEHQVALLDEGAPSSLVDDLLKAVSDIKESKVPNRIKNTRVNYFATIRN